jgi:hypothetical protein
VGQLIVSLREEAEVIVKVSLELGEMLTLQHQLILHTWSRNIEYY